MKTLIITNLNPYQFFEALLFPIPRKIEIQPEIEPESFEVKINKKQIEMPREELAAKQEQVILNAESRADWPTEFPSWWHCSNPRK